MAKKNKKNQKNSSKRFSLTQSYSAVLGNALNDGETIYYAKDCLLPTLNIKALVKERSREELSDIDLLLFKLIEQGIRSISSIVLLTGLAEKLVRKHLNEMLGRSFVDFEDGIFTLTSLGKETIVHGVPVRIVQRAFRYCAVSEQLLPREAYGLVFAGVHQLREKENKRNLRYSHVMEEQQLVNLAGMDLSTVEPKRAFNITDEAISIEEIKDYTSGYLRTKLFLVGRTKPERAIVAFGKSFKEYAPDDVLQTISKLTTKEITEAINKQLAKAEISANRIKTDDFGLPKVYLDSPSDKWLSSKLEGQQAILLCGTSELEAKPVTSGFLKGYTIQYIIESEEIAKNAAILRRFIEFCERYYETPYAERTHRKIGLFISEKYSDEEISSVRTLAQKYDIRRVLSWLPRDVDEAA